MSVAPHARVRRVRRLAASITLAAVLVGADSAVAAGGRAAPAAVPSPAAEDVIGLKYGSYGEPVRVLQRALIRVGVGVKYGVDGHFGSATRASVKAFQAYKGLPVTGVVDRATAQALGLANAPAFNAASASSSGAMFARGAVGDRVRHLQRSLINVGIPVAGGADGVFGPATESAVRAYQRSRGLVATGRADAATLSALNRRAPAIGVGGLARGATGSAVRSLQQALVNAGIRFSGGVDGVFGPATEAAVKSYQRSRGLPVTGRGDAATLNALGRGARASSTPTPTSNVLARGARGDSVRRLQLALMQAGIFVPGGADGIFGPATENALQTYQRRKGLSATGRVDGATAAALGLGSGTPRPTSGSGYIGLRLGSRGTTVQAVQRAIMRSGIRLFGGADGVFGMATQSALMLFQRSQGIPASGVVDAATVRAMGLGGGSSGGGSPGGGSPGGSTAPGYARYDERGGRVVALQQALVRAGVRLCGGVDGVFGSCTASAVMQFQRSRGLPATGRVDQATADRLGLRAAPVPSANPPVTVRLQAEPVEPPCWFSDTWGAPRGSGRVHLGVDIIAATGQRVYAVSSGRITQVYRSSRSSLSGNGLKLTRSDGTYFFYAHLSRFASGIGAGTPVSAGQVIGYVGRTGNAATPHLHFEVHPGGGSAVNPTQMVRAVGAC
jgi:peptidoglycan hydrolase-like protein with peptidoglycan-binding domain